MFNVLCVMVLCRYKQFFETVVAFKLILLVYIIVCSMEFNKRWNVCCFSIQFDWISAHKYWKLTKIQQLAIVWAHSSNHPIDFTLLGNSFFVFNTSTNCIAKWNAWKTYRAYNKNEQKFVFFFRKKAHNNFIILIARMNLFSLIN